MNLQLIENIEEKSQEMASLLKVLSHPLRLQILCSLTEKEKNVGELESELRLSQSQLSQYLKALSLQGILGSTRNGKYVYYKIVDERAVKLLGFLYENFCREKGE